jgi:outer membrane protein OmpA-like peptidoglycan-associated protein
MLFVNLRINELSNNPIFNYFNIQKTMLRSTLLVSFLFFLFMGSVLAQKDPEASKKTAAAATTAKKTKSNLAIPKNMIEIGLNGGATFIGGDVAAKYSYGGGIHIRKALDYMFSLRLDGLYADAKGENPTTNVARDFHTTWYSGTVYGVMSLNSFRFDRPVRSSNPYFMLGAGANNFKVSYNSEDVRKGELVNKFAPHIALGAGWAFRVSKKFNVGIEEQAFMVIGGRGDRIDGIAFTGGSQFRDILSFTNLTFNFNLGSSSSQTEPLYWINPLDGVMNDIEGIKSRQGEALKDEDQDGVIDAIDQEVNTPPGAMVDTKGRTLDSDRDGVPDHIDKEPFYTPIKGEKVNDEGVVVNPITGAPISGGGAGRDGLTEERVKELIDQALQNYTITDNRTSAAEWFLPMLHFSNSSAVIKYSDYGNLSSLARMIKANPTLRLVITGFTDSTGPEAINNNLSYDRAKNVIEHLETTHGIARGRMVLQWKGSADNLVPTNSSFMNRRVEFRLAGTGDVEMDPPAKKEKDGY